MYTAKRLFLIMLKILNIKFISEDKYVFRLIYRHKQPNSGLLPSISTSLNYEEFSNVFKIMLSDKLHHCSVVDGDWF